MASRAWSRPRTRVYASNYDVGESYYKSALDNLDRKYGRSPAPPEPLATNGNHTNGSLSSLRASLERDRPKKHINFDDDEIETPRRKPKTAGLLDEFDSIFERRAKNGVAKGRTPSRKVKDFEDEADAEFEESMKRVRNARANRAAAEDMEEIESNLSSRKKEARTKLNFSSKMIDSVASSEDMSSARKKVLTMVSSPNDSEDITRWTAVKPNRKSGIEEDNDESAAISRARKSRARLQDLEAEMSALEERGAAREKRVRDLRSLLSENEASTKESLHSTIRVKSTVHTEKKQVAF